MQKKRKKSFKIAEPILRETRSLKESDFKPQLFLHSNINRLVVAAVDGKVEQSKNKCYENNKSDMQRDTIESNLNITLIIESLPRTNGAATISPFHTSTKL